MAVQLLPLPLQLPLNQGLLQQRPGGVTIQLAQGQAASPRQGPGPGPPGLLAVALAQHHEAAVVAQPVVLLAPPAGEGLLALLALGRPALQQARPQSRGPQPCRLQVKPLAAAGGQILGSGGVEEPLGHQRVGIEEPGVEGEAAGGAVGGAGAVGGGQGQQLPGGDAGGGQLVDPLASRQAEGSAARSARQGGGMEQHAALPDGRPVVGTGGHWHQSGRR